MRRIVVGQVPAVITFLIVSTLPLSSKDKMKIEIVDTASAVEIGTATSSVPASSAQTVTHCSGISGIYAEVYGHDCTTTNYPATPAHDVNRPYITSTYYARAVMGDGEHVWLSCDLMTRKCGPIEPWNSSQTKETCDNQPSETALYLRVCLRIDPNSKTFGLYEATRDGDDLSIHGPKGKTRVSHPKVMGFLDQSELRNTIWNTFNTARWRFGCPYLIPEFFGGRR